MKKSLLFLVIPIFLAFLAVGSADAVPTLELISGTESVSITDGLGDLNPVAGAVTFMGIVGSWTTNVTTGLTKPIIGAPGVPMMDLNSVDVSSNGAADLIIRWTDTDFALNDGLDGFLSLSAVGGTTTGMVSIQTYLDPENNPFGIGPDKLLSSFEFTKVAFSGEDTALIDPEGLFSLTIVATIQHLRAGATSFDAAISPVPEPATMLLLGTGLIGLAGISRKKFSRKS